MTQNALGPKGRFYQAKRLKETTLMRHDQHNPTRRFVMTENFDWDIYPVCESDETYTLEVYADPEEGGSL